MSISYIESEYEIAEGSGSDEDKPIASLVVNNCTHQQYHPYIS